MNRLPYIQVMLAALIGIFPPTGLSQEGRASVIG